MVGDFLVVLNHGGFRTQMDGRNAIIEIDMEANKRRVSEVTLRSHGSGSQTTKFLIRWIALET